MSQAAIQIGKLLELGKAQNVVVLDVRGKNSWSDYFVIASVSSSIQMKGLQKQVFEAVKDLNLELYPVRKKTSDGDDWVLIDLNTIIVHLMTDTARSFYDLEKLMFGSTYLLGDPS